MRNLDLFGCMATRRQKRSLISSKKSSSYRFVSTSRSMCFAALETQPSMVWRGGGIKMGKGTERTTGWVRCECKYKRAQSAWLECVRACASKHVAYSYSEHSRMPLCECGMRGSPCP